MSKPRIIFVDRDGTIIREPEDEQIDSLEKLSFVPGTISALRQLRQAGFKLIMVTNQDGLGTDSFPEDTFWPAHNKMLETLEGEGVLFDDILIDRSFEKDNSPYRKPGIAMLLPWLKGDYDISGSYVIGDRASDMQLATNIGATGLQVSDAAYSWTDIVNTILNRQRTATLNRKTSETDINLTVNLDDNTSSISTGLGFFDHMLNQIPHHAGIGINLQCKGDLNVDEHHTIEDVAIALGEALGQALGDKRGIGRYGFALPMDESRAIVLLDLGGRDELVWDVDFTREYVGDTPTEMFRHFFKSLSSSLKANIYVQARGDNNHHLAEAVFKAFARALKAAVKRDPFNYDLPSSKGLL